MPTIEMIELYPSPYSERLRWTLDVKGLPYTRRPYEVMVGEEELRSSTGLSTVPVLRVDGRIVGDSNAAVDWIEGKHPAPALLPADPRARAQVRAYELAVTEALGPFARLLMIGTWKRAAGLGPLAGHFAAKYHWSEQAELQARQVVDAFARDLARAVAAAPYLVGDGFTRADLTVASLASTVLGHPDDDLFELDPGLRGMLGTEIATDPEIAPLRSWRDAIYRKHRGRRVQPAR